MSLGKNDKFFAFFVSSPIYDWHWEATTAAENMVSFAIPSGARNLSAV
jgi:hypothetical protein